MGNFFFDNNFLPGEMDRVDARAKVTGAAKYAAEYQYHGLLHAVLVSSPIAKGTIQSIDSKAAEKAPGVVKVISHLNSYKVPAYYDAGGNPVKGNTAGQELRVFAENI